MKRKKMTKKAILHQVPGMDWQEETPIAEAVAKATDVLRSVPEAVTVTVTLSGTAATRYNLINAIMTASGMPKEEVATFLLQAGVEREIARLATAAKAEPQI